MKFSSFILPLAALALAAPAAYAEGPSPQAEAQQNAHIPFVNHGGIRDWRSNDKDTVYIQASNRDWYKATLMSPAFDLPYTTAIGFDTGRKPCILGELTSQGIAGHVDSRKS